MLKYYAITHNKKKLSIKLYIQRNKQPVSYLEMAELLWISLKFKFLFTLQILGKSAVLLGSVTETSYRILSFITSSPIINTHRHTHIYTHIHTHIHMTQALCVCDRQIVLRQSDGQNILDRQTDRQTDTDRQTQTDRHRQTNTLVLPTWGLLDPNSDFHLIIQFWRVSNTENSLYRDWGVGVTVTYSHGLLRQTVITQTHRQTDKDTIW